MMSSDEHDVVKMLTGDKDSPTRADSFRERNDCQAKLTNPTLGLKPVRERI